MDRVQSLRRPAARSWEIPLPGWILAASILVFALTWALAPRASVLRAGLPLAVEGPTRSRAGAARVDDLRLPEGPPSARPVTPGSTVDGLARPGLIALTFDDGPHPVYTRRLLQVLEAHGVKATFFVNAVWVTPPTHGSAEARALLELAHARGHAIGNHTYGHKPLFALSREEQTEEIVAGEEAITRITGERPRFFRAPYAAMTRHVRKVIEERGYVEVPWTATPPDEPEPTPELLRDSLLMWVRHYHGGIVLLHDRTSSVVAGTDLFLTALERENRRRISRGDPLLLVVPLDSFL
jgi:peptidoglycan-N-acetylglucosamine deacetylase